MAMYIIFRSGGFTHGGVNFDAKLRHQSIDPVDLFHAHISGMDVCARGLLIAEKMIEDNVLEQLRKDRYSSWNGDFGQAMINGELSMAEISDQVLDRQLDPEPSSGG